MSDSDKYVRDLLKVKDSVERIECTRKKIEILSLFQICQSLKVHGHIAILSKPYLNLIIGGKKSIESRFNRVRSPPFNRIKAGDIIFLKEKSGPIRAIASVSKVQQFGPLKPGEALRIMAEFQKQLMLDNLFIKEKSTSIYSTLIYINKVYSVKPFSLNKSDRRPWVILNNELTKRNVFTQNQLFPNPNCKTDEQAFS